jgi:hypothetical protein
MITILIVLLVLLLVYLFSKDMLVIHWELNTDVASVPIQNNNNGCWTIFASADVDGKSIPVNQWRVVPTDITIGTFNLRLFNSNIYLHPFGTVGIKVHTLDERAAKGVSAHESMLIGGKDKDIQILLYNHSSYPVRIRKGDPIAQVEVFKISKIFCIK